MMPRIRDSSRGNPETYVGSVRTALKKAMAMFGVTLTNDQATPLVKAVFESFDDQRLVILPYKPTASMIEASMAAMDLTKRSTTAWVDTRQKHQWRLYRALLASPDWREGLKRDAESRVRNREATRSQQTEAAA